MKLTDWVVCVHEAAHAVVYATGGRRVKRIILRGADGGKLSGDMAGACVLEALGYVAPCGWQKDKKRVWVNRQKWDEMRQASADPGAMVQSLYAEMCGLLAGPLSEVRLAGKDGEPIHIGAGGPQDDMTMVFGHAVLAGDPEQVASHFAGETMELLQEPKTWGRVLALALALQKQRALADADLAIYLPNRREGWPRQMEKDSHQ